MVKYKPVRKKAEENGIDLAKEFPHLNDKSIEELLQEYEKTISALEKRNPEESDAIKMAKLSNLTWDKIDTYFKSSDFDLHTYLNYTQRYVTLTERGKPIRLASSRVNQGMYA